MKLLIVEDHPSSRKLLRVQLEAQGHTVLEATVGAGTTVFFSLPQPEGVG
jgi:CheY-like chemotaxis protein